MGNSESCEASQSQLSQPDDVVHILEWFRSPKIFRDTLRERMGENYLEADENIVREFQGNGTIGPKIIARTRMVQPILEESQKVDSPMPLNKVAMLS